MEVIRKELTLDELLSPFIRYDADTDTVQHFIGDAWVDSPENDPRIHDYYPPLDTTDPKCDAAARIVAATQEALALVSDTLGDAATSAQLVGVLGVAFVLVAPYLALLYSLWAELAGVVFGFGKEALDYAFADFDWDDFLCHVRTSERDDGRLDQWRFDGLISYIDATYGDVARAFFHLVYDPLGFGGLNAAAATRGESGDCSECNDVWCKAFDFTLSDQGWTLVSPTTYVDGQGFKAGYLNAASQDWAYIHIEFDERYITQVVLGWCKPNGGGANNSIGVNLLNNGGVVFSHFPAGGNSCPGGYHWEPNQDADQVYLNINSGTVDTDAYILSCELRGLGTNPFGEDDCI